MADACAVSLRLYPECTAATRRIAELVCDHNAPSQEVAPDTDDRGGAHTYLSSSPHDTERGHMSNSSDTRWIVPFYVTIGAGIIFFFSQVAQYGLLPH
jgi:hypothetical protein